MSTERGRERIQDPFNMVWSGADELKLEDSFSSIRLDVMVRGTLALARALPLSLSRSMLPTQSSLSLTPSAASASYTHLLTNSLTRRSPSLVQLTRKTRLTH